MLSLTLRTALALGLVFGALGLAGLVQPPPASVVGAAR